MENSNETQRVLSSAAPAVAVTIGRSRVRRDILGLLLVEPRRRLHLREIQRRAATSPGTAARELAALVAAGLVEREAEGRQVYFRATESPLAQALQPLVVTPAQAASAALDSGTDPGGAAARLFVAMLDPAYRGRIRSAYLAGSDAGTAPPDVEVVLVLDRIDRYDDEIEATGRAAAEASLRSGFPVGRTFVTDEAWHGDAAGFVGRLRERAAAL